MDKRHMDYRTADRYFYDSPTLKADTPGFEVAGRPLPDGWRAKATGVWIMYARDDVTPPRQGWKIHASACPENAEEILDVVWDYCVPRGVPFKHLLGPKTLFANNSKYASRGSSAKLVTIYPLDDDHLGRILAELAPQLEGQNGAYILSDLRWGNGPLYVRYGGFAKRYGMFDRGELEPAIEDPEGRLVPDRREPAFRLPPWVTLPEFLARHLAARNAVTTVDLPYRIDRALHFSNGGGVYLGTNRDSDEQVILKEARPHAGLDGMAVDAVSRLERERMILTQLDDLDFVPSVRDYFTIGEHHFLVQEFMDGKPLNRALRRGFPLDGRAVDETELHEYVDWAVAVIDDVERHVASLRERGMIFGDLHMHNIIVRPDGTTSLIDFEVASFVGEGRRPALGHPGFHAPPDRTGFDVDRYSLACLRLALFLPLTTLFPLDPGKAPQLAAEIYAAFPVPAGYLDDAVRTITAGRAGSSSWPTTYAGTLWERPGGQPLEAGRLARTQQSMVDAILASATPERDDRLFPGDIEQFSTGGLNLAHGAAGVLYALWAAGAGRYPAHEKWLIDHLRRPDPDGRLGFYDGLHGIAYALDRLDRRDEALSLLRRCQKAPWRQLGPDLYGGLAGIGLNLHHFAGVTDDAMLRDAAEEVASLAASRLGPVDGVPTISGGNHPHAGLLRGSAGPALLFIRLFESIGDKGYLDLAMVALDQDLRRCVIQFDGSLQVNEAFRTMPYLGTGSAGIGLVLQEFLRHRPEERYTTALEQITLAARSGYYAQSGLFNGRAGILLFHCGPSPHDEDVRRAEIARQIRHLGWHRLSYQGHSAFPGDQLYRLSMDLGTGAAGVLFALAGAAGRSAASLPFLSVANGNPEPTAHW